MLYMGALKHINAPFAQLANAREKNPILISRLFFIYSIPIYLFQCSLEATCYPFGSCREKLLHTASLLWSFKN